MAIAHFAHNFHPGLHMYFDAPPSRKQFELTCLDRAGREGCRHLLRDGANAVGGKGILPRCQHPHDKLKQAGGDIEFLIKENTT